jgi:3-hydroxy-9,10-secoandrosta-1,3,5(10)-triene-9,17-dione monooxygenase
MEAAEYLGRVEALLPAWAERARECEEGRRVPDASFKEMQQAGLLRALQPKRWGGDELDPWTFYGATARVGTVCPSTAWVLGVVGVHDWQLGLFPEEAQEDVWGADSSVQISSSYAPVGQVEAAEGGFRLSGRWSFSSGCDHCEWVFVGGVVPGAGGDGPPDMRTFLVPRADYEIVDDWHVSGLSGTGSKTIAIESAFVPEHRTHRMLDGFLRKSPGQALNPGPLFRLSFGCVFGSALVGPAIGAARGAIACYREQSRERVSMMGGRVAEDPFAQARIARAISEVDAADERLASVWRELWALAQADAEMPLDLRRRCRFEAARSIERCVDAVDWMFEASGGRAIFLDNPIGRFFRDVHAMRAHVFNNPDRGAQLFGRTELDPDAPPSGPGDFMI